MLNEFYRLRRTAIADSVALVGFVTGFVVSALYGWPYISDKIAAGYFERGVFGFAGFLLAGGLIGGGIGLTLGFGSAWLWERMHRRLRR